MSSSRKKGNQEGSAMDLQLASSNPEIGRSLLQALRNTGITVLCQDRDLRVLWSQNIPAAWSQADVSGKTDHEFLPAQQADRLQAAKRSVLATGQPESLEISLPDREGARWFAIWIDPDKLPNGTAQTVVTTAVDITEQKRREQTLRNLLREVSHRSKNLLAIIQGIAAQTGRHSDTIEIFLARFRGRLQSLASSQDLVTSSNWRGAGLRELVVGQVSRYSAKPRDSVRFEGENPYLNPNAALHIGLAMHELAVNSVSYGALAQPDGFVTVAAHLIAPPENMDLNLSWSEKIAVNGNNGKKRFGSVALERVVPASLNGTATLEISGDRLDYRLLVPHGSFEIE
jgi:two-component sensor histidine kinase